jgi:hypothetical protein
VSTSGAPSRIKRQQGITSDSFDSRSFRIGSETDKKLLLATLTIPTEEVLAPVLATVLVREADDNEEIAMRKLIFATIATAMMVAPIATVVHAEDTTVIKHDNDGDSSKTVIKKKEDVNLLPVPHTEEKKTIIKKEND